MTVRYLSSDYAVAPQILPADVARLKEQGFAALVCNRPDGEAIDQPQFAAIEAQARECGMKAYYLPVVPGRITQSDRDAFAEMFELAPKPLLGFCRTGMRAETLWSDTRHAGPDGGLEGRGAGKQQRAT